jgi:hypothetical protein
MDNKERLQKLRLLQITHKNESALHSREVLLLWIDKVAPLLKYNPQHYETFLNSSRTASMPLSSQTITHFLDIAKSTVNQAIIELENNIDLPKIPEEAPNPSRNNPDDIHNWYEKPLGKIAIGVIIFVLGIITIWVINHYFPFLNL